MQRQPKAKLTRSRASSRAAALTSLMPRLNAVKRCARLRLRRAQTSEHVRKKHFRFGLSVLTIYKSKLTSRCVQAVHTQPRHFSPSTSLCLPAHTLPIHAPPPSPSPRQTSRISNGTQSRVSDRVSQTRASLCEAPPSQPHSCTPCTWLDSWVHARSCKCWAVS